MNHKVTPPAPRELLDRWMSILSLSDADFLYNLCIMYDIIDDMILIALNENDFNDLGLPRQIARTIPWGEDDPLWETLWGDLSSDNDDIISVNIADATAR